MHSWYKTGMHVEPILLHFVGELVTMFKDAECQGVFIDENVPNLMGLLFADDVVAGADTVGRLQKMIDLISSFCSKWGLIVNLLKTKVMFFSERRAFAS